MPVNITLPRHMTGTFPALSNDAVNRIIWWTSF